MRKKDYKFLTRLIVFIHSIIVIVSLSAMVLIFYEKFKIYAAIWFIGMFLVEKIYGACPLTVEEYVLRKKSGERVKKTKFIPAFFKRYFGLKISDKLAGIWLGIFVIISIYVIVRYLFI